MDEHDHMKSAESEARMRGMAFLVDGHHVCADRVMILSVPDTTGPISEMRKAKVEAKKAYEQLTVAVKVEADSETLKALSGCIALLRGCYDALGANHGLVRSETRLAIGKFLEQLAAPYAKGGLVSDSSIYAVNNGGAFSEKTTPASNTPQGMSKPVLAVINGIEVTDPALVAPITDAVAGESRACGVCGNLYADDESLFCPGCR